MSDTSGPTVSELIERVEELEAANARLREVSDGNYEHGNQWREQANKLADQVKDLTAAMSLLRDAASVARTEAAELRGYIRRVNELDPPERRILEDKYSGDTKFDPSLTERIWR